MTSATPSDATSPHADLTHADFAHAAAHYGAARPVDAPHTGPLPPAPPVPVDSLQPHPSRMRRRHILLIALSTSVVLACWTMAALVLVPQVVDMLYVSALEAVLGETLGDAAPNHAAFPDAVRHAACRSGMGAG